MDMSTIERELRAAQIEMTLRDFVKDINAAGGIVDEDGGKRVYLVGDISGSDLGLQLAPTYLRACEALDLTPQIQYE